jgi:hypothetical protein
MRSKKDELRPEYSADLIKSGVRGKYATRYRATLQAVAAESAKAHATTRAR